MRERICRLCLQTISKNNYQTIGESMLKTLKLNLKISKESVMCIECADCLRVSSKFIPGCSYVDDETLPIFYHQNDFKLEPVEIEAKSNLPSLIKTELKCNFCAEALGREDLISLNESKFMVNKVNMMEQYISKMDLKNTEELLTCGTCLVALQGVLNFILKCSEVEEKISEYIELKGTDDEDQIELKEVQQFMLRPIIKFEVESVEVNELGERCDQIKEEYSTMAQAEIKYEKGIINPELIIKTEDDDITSGQSDCDGLQEPFIEYQVPNDPLGIPVVTSETRKCKEHIKQHLITHKISSEITFHCELCSYESTRMSGLRSHLLIHKSPSELKMFKCESCSYEAKHKYSLKMHSLTHKSLSELKMFKCELCSYESTRKSGVKNHLLIHKSPSEIKMFECELCPYQAKRKDVLKNHLLTHKSPSEIRMFKCQLCSYETKYKSVLQNHLLTHKSHFELEMFKCELCSYETKHKYALARHSLNHKKPSEVKKYKCKLCSYEAKYKCLLNRHLLTHKSPSELKMFKCELCSYESIRKATLKRHLLTHKGPVEIKTFKCESCSYEARQKYIFKRHLLSCKSPLDK